MKIRCCVCDKLVETENWSGAPFVCEKCSNQGNVPCSPADATTPLPAKDEVSKRTWPSGYRRASRAVGILEVVLGVMFVVAMPVIIAVSVANEGGAVLLLHVGIAVGICAGFLTLGIASLGLKPWSHYVSGPVGLLAFLVSVLDSSGLFEGNVARIAGRLAVSLALLAIGVGSTYCILKLVRKTNGANASAEPVQGK